MAGSLAESLSFLLAGVGVVLFCGAVSVAVHRRRRHAIMVAAGPEYAAIQAAGGAVWVLSTVVFNDHIAGYSPRATSLPTCFFWRCACR